MVLSLSARSEAVSQAQLYIQNKPVYLDTETTGTGPTAEVIEVAILDHDGSVLLESLVKHKGSMDPAALRVHGITPDRLQDAPSWMDIWPRVEAILTDRQAGIYNSEFDLRLMKQSHQRFWMNWQLSEGNFFCIMKLYARFHGEWDRQRGSFRYQSLDQASRQCGIMLPNSHRAKDDALLTRALLQYMAAWEGPG